MDINKEVRELVVQMGTDLAAFTAEHKSKMDGKDAIYDEKIAKLTDAVTKTHEQLALIETKQNRVVLAGDADEAKLEAKAHAQFNRELSGLSGGRRVLSAEEFKGFTGVFGSYLRSDKDRMDQIQVKALSLGSDPDGGYFLTPPDVANRITTRVFESTPMRDLATVQAISSHEHKIPQDPNSAISGGWTGELSSRTATATSQIAMKTITAFEQYAMPVVSQQLLEDSAVNIETWYADKTADIMARTENTAFVTGSGAAQPKGSCPIPPAPTGARFSRSAPAPPAHSRTPGCST